MTTTLLAQGTQQIDDAVKALMSNPKLTVDNSDTTRAPKFTISNPDDLQDQLMVFQYQLKSKGISPKRTYVITTVNNGVEVKVILRAQDPDKGDANDFNEDFENQGRGVYVGRVSDGEPGAVGKAGNDSGSANVDAYSLQSLILFGGNGGKGGDLAEGEKDGHSGGQAKKLAITYHPVATTTEQLPSTEVFVWSGNGGDGRDGKDAADPDENGGWGGIAGHGGDIEFGLKGFAKGSKFIVSGEIRSGKGGVSGHGKRGRNGGNGGSRLSNRAGDIVVGSTVHVEFPTANQSRLKLVAKDGGPGGNGGAGVLRGGDAWMGGRGGDVTFSWGLADSSQTGTAENIATAGGQGASGTKGVGGKEDGELRGDGDKESRSGKVLVVVPK